MRWRRIDQQRSSKQVAVGLFGGSPANALGHISSRYPYPARLTDPYLAMLRASHAGTGFRRGTILFHEGAKSTGVYLVLEGSAKLSVNSAQGKTLVLGVFGAGTILGLASAILGRPHEATAETLKPTTVLFVPREKLLLEMRTDAAAARQTAELVSESYYFILSKLKAVDLSESARQRLARCLLGLLAHNSDASAEAALQLGLNQETLAQMVGLSRETVSRLLSGFRDEHILDWRRSELVIRDRRALERLADFPEGPSSGNQDDS